MSGFNFGYALNTEEIETGQEIIEGLLGKAGTAFFVSTTGSDSNDGLSKDTPFLTIDRAMNACTPDVGDVILVAPGLYNEVANGANGVECDVSMVTILSIRQFSAFVINSNQTDGGAVFTVSAQSVTIKGFTIQTGTVANVFHGILCNSTFRTIIDDCIIGVQTAGHFGIKTVGFTLGLFLRGSIRLSSAIASLPFTPRIGTGIEINSGAQCTLAGTAFSSLDKGIVLAAGTLNVGILENCIVTDCNTGLEIQAGVTNTESGAAFTFNTNDIVDNSGNATNSTWSSVTFLREDVSHIPQFAGSIYFVNSATGKDTNDGVSPLTAFATISRAITVASTGDAITIRAGTYDENGLDLSKNGLQLWCETGVTFINTTPGTVLTVSANDCLVRDLSVSQAGQKAFDVTGSDNQFIRCLVENSSTGFDLSGTTNSLSNCRVIQPSICAFDIDGSNNLLIACDTNGAGGSTTGFKVFGGADAVRLITCNSTGHGTAGFKIESGSSQCLVNRCSSGGGDGERVDDGEDNMFADFQSIMDDERHEHVYPLPLGEGVANDPINVNNTATDDTPVSSEDQNFWGDTVVIIPVNTLTDEWLSVGVEIFAVTSADIQSFQIMFPSPAFSTTRNGGNAWDLGETVLTVTDASIFQTSDKVWIASTSDPQGEILIITNIAGNVITVASEVRASANTGVRYNHAGAETMYLVQRDTDPQWNSFDLTYSAASARDFFAERWHEAKRLRGNDGAIMRMLNASDNLPSSLDIKLLYEG